MNVLVGSANGVADKYIQLNNFRDKDETIKPRFFFPAIVPKIGVGICFYNDAKSLQRCLDSLVSTHGFELCQVFCIDGKYETDYSLVKEDVQGISTDGSIDMVREYLDEFDNIQLVTYPLVSEIEKRNMYIQLCQYNKLPYLLIMDSDEYLKEHGDFEFLLENVPDLIKRDGLEQKKENGLMFHVRMINKAFNPNYGIWVDEYTSKPRLWYKPELFSYWKRHYQFFSKALQSEHEEFYGILEGITIKHDQALRDENHLKERQKYQKWLFDKESKVY